MKQGVSLRRLGKGLDDLRLVFFCYSIEVHGIVDVEHAMLLCLMASEEAVETFITVDSYCRDRTRH